ncbi:MAG: SDR family oxidoreductase [Pseudomonadales bacterium]
MDRFTNKVVVITGAASGIGRACAQRVAAEGASLFCLDISLEGLEEMAQELAAGGTEIAIQQCDVSNEASVNSAIAACIEKFGKIDALVHMAGILRFDHTHELELVGWQKVIDVNVTGTFLLCKAALPHLIESKGNIVNAASTASLAGLPHGACYSASKGAVLAFTRAIAVEYAKRGVRANCVCPGDINTNMTSGIPFPDDMDMALLQRTMSITGPTGPEVIASVVAMLASDDGRHITGEDIRIDGGTLA